MKLSVDGIKERLLRVDEDIDLLLDNEIKINCYIVGGSALLINDYVSRITNDIDVLEVEIDSSEDISSILTGLFKNYQINTSVKAYGDNFPSDYKNRVNEIDLDTKRIKFYTLSLEDLVVSKLCTNGREKDWKDILSENVKKNIDWIKLNELVLNLKKEMFSSSSKERLENNYKEYIERCKEK